MGQCICEDIGTKCDNKNQIEKVRELRMLMNENNKLKIEGEEDNNIKQIEKNEDTNILINTEREKTKEELKKEEEERKN